MNTGTVANRNAVITASLAIVLTAMALKPHDVQSQSATQGDIVFLVDESGSVQNIQAGLANNVINVANQLTTEGIDWRIGIGGFGRSGSSNPRVAAQFTGNIADVQAAVATLAAAGSTEYGLQAIINATTGVTANYGAVRSGVGYCVVLLTDEDSNYIGDSATQRNDALAGLLASRAGFIAAVEPRDTNTDADYAALVAPGSGVPGKIFDITDFIANPDSVTREIIDTCIKEIILADPSLTISDVTVNESDGSAGVTVSLSPAATDVVEVTVSSVDDSAIQGNDYTSVSTTLTFAPGETTKSVDVPIIDDAVAEPTETLKLLLSNASSALIRDGEGVVTILDNDSGGGKGGKGKGGGSGSGSSSGSSSGGSSSGSKLTTDASTRAGLQVAVNRVTCHDQVNAVRCLSVIASNNGDEDLRRIRVMIRNTGSVKWKNLSRRCRLPRTLAAGTSVSCVIRNPSDSRRRHGISARVTAITQGSGRRVAKTVK